jgi:hypothetical protein
VYEFELVSTSLLKVTVEIVGNKKDYIPEFKVHAAAVLLCHEDGGLHCHEHEQKQMVLKIR